MKRVMEKIHSPSEENKEKTVSDELWHDDLVLSALITFFILGFLIILYWKYAKKLKGRFLKLLITVF